MDPTSGTAVYSRFLRGRELSPGREAVRVGGEAVTYTEAHRLALCWAGALARAGAGAGHPVGVLATQSVTAYVGILAALYTGAPVVPLHPAFPAARTARMMRAAGVSALLVDGAGRAALADLRSGLGGLDLPVVDPDRDAPWFAGSLPAPVPVDPADPAYVLFTSGSTGRPKGVPISHASLDHYFRLLDDRYDFRPDDVFSQTFDLNFDCAMFDLFAAWGSGATVVRIPPPAYRDLPAFLAAHRVTVWFSTPSAIAAVRSLGGLGPRSLPGLRWSFFAGEALRCDDVVDWQRAAAKSTVENLYGPTELTITVSAHRWSPRSAELAVNGVVPIGTVHEGHRYLLLTDDGATVPGEAAVDGLDGELVITGPQLTTGYLDPTDGEGRFLHHDGLVWYRTGDRVRRLPDGELAYLGRLDSQVQVHGLRVELAEIDHAVRGCAEVRDAVTLGVPAGGSTELIVFYTGRPVPPSVLARQLNRVLPAALVPRHFHHLEELPLNPNRKVDRAFLRSSANELVTTGEHN